MERNFPVPALIQAVLYILLATSSSYQIQIHVYIPVKLQNMVIAKWTENERNFSIFPQVDTLTFLYFVA